MRTSNIDADEFALREMSKELKALRDLLDDCYGAVAAAIYSDDELDGREGEELLVRIKEMVPDGKLVTEWTKELSDDPVPNMNGMMNRPKPTIAELEKLLNSEKADCSVALFTREDRSHIDTIKAIDNLE